MSELEEIRKKFSDIEPLEIFKKGYVKWVKIRCPKHGVFEKRYYDLMRSSYGCPKCGRSAVNEIRYKKPFSDFLKKVRDKFGDRFTILDEKEYYYDNELVNIKCPEHGIFKIEAGSFLRNLCGCPKCGHRFGGQQNHLTTEEIIKTLQETRGGENYDFSKVKWIDSEHNIEVICKTHGAFSTRYNDFIRGIDCPQCAIEKRRAKEEQKLKKFLLEKYKDKIQFPDGFSYVNSYTPVKILYCGEEIIRDPRALKEATLLTSSEKMQNIINRGVRKAQNRWKNFDAEFKEMFPELEISADSLNHIKSGFCKKTDLIDIKCPKHGWKKQNFFQLRDGYGCPSCFYKKTSAAEAELASVIKEVYSGEIELNSRRILDGKELDIYIPDKKIAIEYDGIYWHNDVNNYYKFLGCKEKGIRLIQVTEWEWKNKRKLIEIFLKHLFKYPERRIFARSCVVKEISSKEFNQFCGKYHLQGSVNSSVRLGLFYQEELLEVEGFSKARFGKYEWELTRECSKEDTAVIGGKSKLLAYFEKKYKPHSLVSYCEKNKFSGDSYYKCGFRLLKESQPSYSYYKGWSKYSRIRFQKHKLRQLLPVFDENLTEWENMRNNKYLRLFDYGNFVFLKEYKNI